MAREQSPWNLSNPPLSFDLSRTPSQLQGDISRVVQGIIPEFQNELMRSNSNGNASDNNSSHPPPIHGQYSVPIGDHSDNDLRASFQQLLNPVDSIIDMSSSHFESASRTDEMTESADNVLPNMLPSGASTPNSENRRNSSGNGHNINLQTIRSWMEGYFPFILIVLSKLMYDHRLGILIFICMFGTFYHANSCLKSYITQREVTRSMNILCILCFILANIFFIFYVFDDDKLYRALYFQLPNVEKVDLWSLLWIVGMMDFVVKFTAIAVKAVFALSPKYVLPHKKKGKYYMIVEYLSQFYRCILPIMPWISFIIDNEYGGEVFSYFLLGFYCVCKSHHLYHKYKELKDVVGKFTLDVSYGSSPSHQDLKEADKCCPICQDKLNDPVKLTCKHIFCEDCVSLWFDRERTCPMCRAKIIDNPLWRDGSTSGLVQLY